MNDLVTFEQGSPQLTAIQVRQQVNLIQQVMQEVMKEGEHYGYVPGTEPRTEDEKKLRKPSLLKPGAEKLLLVFRLDPQYAIVKERDGNHLSIDSTCTLYHIPTGQRMGSGMGSATSRESKYAYRMGKRICPHCHAEAIIKGKEEYGGGWLCFERKGGCKAKFKDGDPAIEGQQVGRVDNEDIADQHNTVLKMANKRSLVAAVLNVTAASDFFTQDIEDLPPEADGDEIMDRPTSRRRPNVEGPRSKSAKEPASGQPSNAEPPKGDSGTAPDAGNGDPARAVRHQEEAQARADASKATGPVTQGMLNILRAKLKAAASVLGDKAPTESSLCLHFQIGNIEELPAAKINEAIGCIANPPGV